MEAEVMFGSEICVVMLNVVMFAVSNMMFVKVNCDAAGRVSLW